MNNTKVKISILKKTAELGNWESVSLCFARFITYFSHEPFLYKQKREIAFWFTLFYIYIKPGSHTIFIEIIDFKNPHK